MALEVDVDSRTLFIGNLDKNVTEEILYELFLQAGPVERVSIPVNNSENYKFGFVTYKHECSVEYAIELYKGTQLFRKELLIKKKGSRNGNNNQQPNDLNAFDKSQIRFNQDFQDTQDQIRNFQKAFSSPNYHNLPMNNSHNMRGPWPNHSKPYDRGPRNYSARPREIRDRRKDRDYVNKISYRKNRHRD